MLPFLQLLCRQEQELKMAEMATALARAGGGGSGEQGWPLPLGPTTSPLYSNLNS